MTGRSGCMKAPGILDLRRMHIRHTGVRGTNRRKTSLQRQAGRRLDRSVFQQRTGCWEEVMASWPLAAQIWIDAKRLLSPNRANSHSSISHARSLLIDYPGSTFLKDLNVLSL